MIVTLVGMQAARCAEAGAATDEIRRGAPTRPGHRAATGATGVAGERHGATAIGEHHGATATEAAAADGLRPLLERAAALDLGDRVGWQQLAAEACATIDVLIAARAVPDHLAVRAGEPAVVVRRTIAAAYRHATAAG